MTQALVGLRRTRVDRRGPAPRWVPGAQLACAAVRVLSVEGAGVVVPRSERLVRAISATSDQVERVERLQESLQDGPCRASCDLAVDDFGAGYSPLGRLEQIPASILKIDRSFARERHTSPAAGAVVPAVLLLGRSLHRTVVVEGVEDARTLGMLAALGCTHVQGFYLGEPQAAPQYARQLAG